MKWSPPVDRLLGGLVTLALFAIGHRGPTGDDWTWETPKGPAKAPLGGPFLPLATAVAVGMMFGVATMASFDRNDGPSRLTVLEPSPTAAASATPTERPTPAIVRAPESTPNPTATLSPAPPTFPPARTATPAPQPSIPAALVQLRGPISTQTSMPTAMPTPVPTPVQGPTQPPTPVPTPTPPPFASEEGKVTGGGQAGGGQFSIDVFRTGNGAANGHFNYHSRDLRIESGAIQSIVVASGPCGPETRAIVAGAGTVNGDADTAFQVTADDCGEPGGWPPGGADYLRIAAGAFSADGQVSGNVQVQISD